MRQCLECGTSFKSDKVEFCFACGAPLPEPSEEAVGPNLAEALDPLELDVPEPESIQEQDEPTEVLDYNETSQPIARPAGLDGARGPVTETPTGEVVLTEDLEIPIPMLQAPPPTAPVPMPPSASEPSQSKFPSNIQVGTHLSEADTVPVEPVILSSAEVEEVDTADTDLPFLEAENTESLPNRDLSVVPGLSEPEMLGVLDEPTAPMLRPIKTEREPSFPDGETQPSLERSFFDKQTDYASEETAPTAISEGLDYQDDQGRGYGMAWLGAAVVVLGIGGIVLWFSGSDDASNSDDAVAEKSGSERAERETSSAKTDLRPTANPKQTAKSGPVNKASQDGRAMKPDQGESGIDDANQRMGEAFPSDDSMSTAALDMNPVLDENVTDESIQFDSSDTPDVSRVDDTSPRVEPEVSAQNESNNSNQGTGQLTSVEASNDTEEATAANLWGVEESGSGILSIRTVPSGALVRVDGSQVGRSPVEIERRFSTVSIQASLDGYKAKYLSYDFKNEGQPVDIRLEKIVQEGQVTVYGALGAKLFVDDTPVGKLPMTLNLKEGSYQFRAVTDAGSECVVNHEISFAGSQIPRVNLGC